MRDFDLGGERRTTEGTQVDVRHDMGCDIHRVCDPSCRIQLDLVALAVTEAQGVRLEAIGSGERKNRRRVKAAAQ
jgi:hypothetical protein